MPWGVAAAVAGAAVSGSMSSSASKNAANQQKGAADAANFEQKRQFDQTREDNLPALDARNNALARMQNLATAYQGGPRNIDVTGEPGYQFGLNEGRNALEGSAAASGGLFSGAVGKALQKYGNDYASTKYTDAFNRIQSTQTNDFNRQASISGQGQTGANTLATAGQNYANNVGNNMMGAANAGAANSIAQGNIWGNALNGAISSMKTGGGGGGMSGWFGGGAQAGFSQTGLGGSGFGNGLAYGNQDLGGYL